MIQKHIKGWKVGLEAEMGFTVSEAHSLPMNVKTLEGSYMVNFCVINYPLHLSLTEVVSQRVMIDKAFSVTKCVR